MADMSPDDQRKLDMIRMLAAKQKRLQESPPQAPPRRSGRAMFRAALNALHALFESAWKLAQAVFVAALVGFYIYSNGSIGKIHRDTANDLVQQYNIAKSQGDPMAACVHAGIVAAAYLQAQDSANYSAWKTTEQSDCRRAGVPN